MADKNAGKAKPVAVTSITLSGADAANYSVSGNPATAVSGSVAITVDELAMQTPTRVVVNWPAVLKNGKR